MKKSSIAAAALGVTLLSACKKQENPSPVLAQVGDASLTLDDLRESFPAEFEQLIRREQYLDFIKRWIDDEAVYQQAKKADLEADPAVARKLEKVRRKLLIEEFLARENAADVFEPDEMAMNQYYEMRKEDFRRKVPEYKYAHIRAQTGKQATDLRYKAMRSDFLAVASASSLDPAPESYASIAFKKLSEIPPCLAQDIDKSGIGGVSLPVACPDGFYLVKVLERQDAGSLIPFSEAREEISAILFMERKDKLLENRIAKYKEGLPVSFNLENIPGLSETGDAPDLPNAADTAKSASAPSVSEPVRTSAVTDPPPARAARPVHATASSTSPASPAPPSSPTGSPDAAAPRLPREPWEVEPETKPKPARKPARAAARSTPPADDTAAAASPVPAESRPEPKTDNPENQNAPE